VKKIAILIIFLITALGAYAQQPTNITVIYSDSLYVIGPGMQGATHPIFFHEGSTMSADSVKLNRDLNMIDAFGHVVIKQQDGQLIYSDLLNYNGNTRQAVLTNNVRLIDKDATLTTNYFTYNLGTKIGTYTSGGKIVNKNAKTNDVLTSRTGYYFGATKDAYFRYDVVITTKDALIKADTMKYNTITKDVNFFGPTHIYGKKDTIYTELGDYNTETRIAHGTKNNIYQQGTRTLKSDTGYFDDIKGTGKVTGNVYFADTEQKVLMRSSIGNYLRADSSIVLTKNAYIAFVTQDSAKADTIWMSGDSLITKVIYKKDIVPLRRPSAQNFSISKNQKVLDLINKNSRDKSKPLALPARDSLIISRTDTSKTRIVFAYHHVKIFKSDLQAVTDSMSYNYADSVIRCYRNPMIWAQGTQLSGDTLLLKLKNSKLDNMLIQYNGFIAMTEGDSTRFNQIKGRFLTGVFVDNKLQEMFVDGNAERIYFIKDSTGYTSMNRTTNSGIYFKLLDNKLVRMYGSTPEGSIIPIKNVNAENEVLKGFVWKPKERPKSKEEIIPKQIASEVPKAPVKPPVKAPVKAPAKQPAKKTI
jgi:lipopolysaccharide export system protein LptA